MGGMTSVINRDDALAHLLIAYGHYLMLRPEVKRTGCTAEGIDRDDA